MTTLRDVLAESQRLGMLGARPVDDVIEHARSFVVALDGLDGRVLDLGSGGGVPGLVIAADRPDLRVTLIDRRMKRTDFLERTIRRLDWSDRVTVICGDAARLPTDEPFDAVVARSFGPPTETLTTAARLTRPGGRIVISEPPAGDRWSPETLALARVVRHAADHRVAVFERLGERPFPTS